MRIVFALLTMMLFGCSSAISATYYVDQNHGSANDSNAGTNEALPWLTIGKATSTVVAGDTVIVKAGTYTDSSASANFPYPAFNPTNNGSSGSPIIFRSEPNLAATIEARSWNPSGSSAYMAWGLNLKSYITIDGFKITGGFRAYASDYITIQTAS